MIRNSKRTFLVAALAALVALIWVAVPSQARKVGNPGPVTFNVIGGQLKVGSNQFEAGTPEEPITFTGTVDAAGNVTVPQSNIVFPPIDPIVTDFGTINVAIKPRNAGTGTVNPFTGVATLTVSIRVELSGGPLNSPPGPTGCRIEPIDLNLSTSTAGGSPYNPGTGAATLADQTFNVPGAQGCTYFLGNANGLVNDAAGLPSGPGNNFAIMATMVSPIITKGVQAQLSATPDSGLEPLSTTLSAAGSFRPAAPHPTTAYSWDFDGNGTFDQNTATSSVVRNYTAPGVYNARVRVMDIDGDFDIATKQITVLARVPDLTIQKSHTDAFTEDVESDFKINVKGIGTGAGDGPVTVTDTLDPGFTFISADGGPDWDCSASAGQNVSCTHAGGYTETEVLPEITVRVKPNAGTGATTIDNTATVSNADDGVAGNNSSTDSVTVITAGIDVRMDKQTEGPAFLRGRRGTWILDVKNIGNETTTGDVVVTDALPAGTTLVSAFGPGFDCEASTNTNVSCELRSNVDTLEAGESTQIRVRVDVAGNAPASLANTASVATAGDTAGENDSDTETTPTRATGVDLIVDKSHSGTFEREQTHTYAIVAKNQGTLGTAGPITVTDTLPVGLEYVSAVGSGWVCNGAPANPTVTCTRAASLQADSQTSTITLRVKVKADAPDEVTNHVDVSNGSPANPDHVDLDQLNNGDDDVTQVRSLNNDLSIDKSHTGNFIAGKTHTFSIKVKNNGADRTLRPITVTDNVPANFVVSAVTGSGWSCNTGQNITCTRSAELASGATTPEIIITGVPNRFSPPSISNTATVATDNDSNATNNSDTDVANVSLPAPNTQPVTSIQGTVTYPSTVSGNATFSISVTRGLLALYTGNVKIIDPGANHNISANIGIFNSVGRTGLNGATGNATLANGQRILWSVDDLSALNLGGDEVYAIAPSGYNTVTARVATAGNIIVAPGPTP